MVDKMNYDKILSMYQDRFKDASDFTFILVGNVDVEAVKPPNRVLSGFIALHQPQGDIQGQPHRNAQGHLQK